MLRYRFVATFSDGTLILIAKHVLITGGSQGSGKATALKFARNGWDVTIAARGGDRLEDTAEQIRAAGQKVLAVPTDVGVAEQVSDLIEQSLETFGQIDALINNAGICLTGPAVETTLEDWRQIIDTNLWGYIYTIQAALPAMLARGKGSIVNVGSFGGKMPLPNMTAYCTSKYAITGLTETLRLELSPQGIHVGIVQPGVVDSTFMERAMFRGGNEDEVDGHREQMSQALQSGLASQPEDIAAAVWKMVEKREAETVVGPVSVATGLNRLFPGLTQWALAQAVR